MTDFHWKIIGCGVVALLAFVTLACGLDHGSMQACVRLSVHGIVSTGLLFGSMAMGVWLGVETARLSKRSWLGWIVGIGVALALGGFLDWIGFLPEGRSDFDD